ncbi:TPA: hypothetical protein ACIKY6_001768 [Campylobacter jejuni]|nr:hypothetical protein [Campylobacter jejuni]
MSDELNEMNENLEDTTKESHDDILKSIGSYSSVDYILMLTNNVIFQSMTGDIDKLAETDKITPQCKLIYEEIKKLKKSSANSIDKHYSLLVHISGEDAKVRASRLITYFSGLKSFNEISQIAGILQKWCNRLLFEHYVTKFSKHNNLTRLQEEISDLEFKPIKVIPKTNFIEITPEELEDMVGETEVLPSCMESINKTNDFGGYIKGTIVAVAGAPGCLVGSTVVRIGTENVKIEDVYKNPERWKYNGRFVLWSANPITCRIHQINSMEIELTKHVTRTIKISLDKEHTNPVETTPEHEHLCCLNPSQPTKTVWLSSEQIMSKVGSGEDVWIMGYQAKTKRCRLGWTEYANFVSPSFRVASAEIVEYDEPIPVYDMLNVGEFQNYGISIGNGYVMMTHNSGKSNFLMYEAYNLCVNHNKRGFWLALGDLMEVDFIARFGSIYYQTPKREIIENLPIYYNDEFRNTLGSNLDFAIIEPGRLSVEEFKEAMLEELSRVKDGFYDFIVVDYDANFSNLETDDMYQAHAVIYQELVSLAKTGKKCLVFVASQVKNEYQYNTDIIPANGLAESSKKQNIIDMLITITRKDIQKREEEPSMEFLSDMVNGGSDILSKYPNANSIGYINKAKERRGNTLAIPYVSSGFSYKEIGVSDYLLLKKMIKNK